MREAFGRAIVQTGVALGLGLSVLAGLCGVSLVIVKLLRAMLFFM